MFACLVIMTHMDAYFVRNKSKFMKKQQSELKLDKKTNVSGSKY